MLYAVAKMREMFFDAPRVIGAVRADTRLVLSRFGAFVRTTAQRSMPKRLRASKPGQPPSTHEGSLRRLILFGFDTTENSVVIGPVPLPKTSGAPGVLEHGGQALVKVKRIKRVLGKSGEIRIGGRSCKTTRSIIDRHGQRRRVTYGHLYSADQVARANQLQGELYGPAGQHVVDVEPRPFMMPAAQKEMHVLDDLWRDSLQPAAAA